MEGYLLVFKEKYIITNSVGVGLLGYPMMVHPNSIKLFIDVVIWIGYIAKYMKWKV